MPEIFILVLMEFQWPSLQIYWKFSHIKWKKLNDVNHILMWLRLTGSLFLLITQFKKLKQNFVTANIFSVFPYVYLSWELKPLQNMKHSIYHKKDISRVFCNLYMYFIIINLKIKKKRGEEINLTICISLYYFCLPQAKDKMEQENMYLSSCSSCLLVKKEKILLHVFTVNQKVCHITENNFLASVCWALQDGVLLVTIQICISWKMGTKKRNRGKWQWRVNSM